MKTLVAQTVDQWRQWLGEHHDSESEVWLIFHKRHTSVESIAYLDALDEALCFGWVDSLVKRLLKPSGIDRAPTNRSYGPRPPRFQMPRTLPRYIQTALWKQPTAWRYFQTLAPSHRRRYIGWIESAKLEKTKFRRLEEAIRLLAQANHWDSSDQPCKASAA